MCGERRHNFQMSTVVCTKDDDSAHLLVLHCSASLDGEISLEHLPRISTHYFCTCSNGLLFHITKPKRLENNTPSSSYFPNRSTLGETIQLHRYTEIFVIGLTSLYQN